MTRADYIAIAANLKGVRQSIDNHTAEPTNTIRLEVWRECVVAMCRAFEADNPRFSRGKFIEACGVPNTLDK